MRLSKSINRIGPCFRVASFYSNQHYASGSSKTVKFFEKHKRLINLLRLDLPFFLGIPVSILLMYINFYLALFLSIFLLLMGLWFCLQVVESSIVYAPNEPPTSKLMYLNPSTSGFSTWEIVKLFPDGKSGPMIIGFLLLQADLCLRKSSPVILLLHGNAGNATARLPMCQILEARLTCNFLIIDYRGYGRSTGTPSELGLYDDASSAIDYLFSRNDLNCDKIFVLGRSIGGAVALYLATNPVIADKLCGVILENTFTSLPAIASHFLNFDWELPPWVFLNRYPSLDRLSACSVDAERASKVPPLLLLSGDLDSIVPPKMMWKLADAYQQVVSQRYGSSFGSGDNNNLSKTVNPDVFILCGSDGLVRFPKGQHNDTWLCSQWADVIARFVQQAISLPRRKHSTNEDIV